MKRALMIILAATTLLLTDVKSEAQPQDDVVENIALLHVWEVANEFDLDYYLLASLVYQESRFIVEDNLTQITNRTWFREGFDYCGSDDITNPYVNIRVCGYYLNKWAQEYEGEPALWLMMWNEGYENALKHYNGAHPSRYAKEILQRAELWEGDSE